MNWHYSRVLVEEYLEGISSAGDASAQSNMNASNQLYSSSGKMTGFCRRSQSGMTCEPLTDDLGEALLMSFLADSLAKTSAPPPITRNKPDSMGPGRDSGPKWQGSLMKYDPVTHSLRTRQLSFIEDLIEFSPILPQFGLMLDGECFPQPTLEHDTSVKGYGSQPSIGTPVKITRSRSMARRDVCPKSYALNPYEYCKRKNGRPKIEWIEHLMGWPTGWTDMEPLETDKFRQWSLLHGECSWETWAAKNLAKFELEETPAGEDEIFPLFASENK
jgi:hypothetical protein